MKQVKRATAARRLLAAVGSIASIALFAACTTAGYLYPRDDQQYLPFPNLSIAVDGSEAISLDLPSEIDLDSLPVFSGDLRDVAVILEFEQVGDQIIVHRLVVSDLLYKALTDAYETTSGPSFTNLTTSPMLVAQHGDQWWAVHAPAETAAERLPAAVANALAEAEHTPVGIARILPGE